MPTDQLVAHFIEHERTSALLFLRSRFSISDDDADDLVQNACIALYENIHSGKYHQQPGVTLSTYFKSICWRMACKFVTRKPSTVPIDQLLPKEPDQYDPSQLEYIMGLAQGGGITQEQRATMRRLVQDLPSPCEDILWAYYGDNLSMKEITELIGFRNADSTKSKKSWCISRLKERFTQIKNMFYDD